MFSGGGIGPVECQKESLSCSVELLTQRLDLSGGVNAYVHVDWRWRRGVHIVRSKISLRIALSRIRVCCWGSFQGRVRYVQFVVAGATTPDQR